MTDSQHWFTLIALFMIGILTYYLGPILTPFLLAFLLAFLFNPIVERLTKWHFPRILAVITVFIIIILITLCLLFLIIPLIEQQITILIQSLPQINAWLTNTIWPWLVKHFNLPKTLDLNQIQHTLTQNFQSTNHIINRVWIMASQSGLALVHFISCLIIIPVVTFYLLRDWPKIITACVHLLPKNSEKRIVKMAHECAGVLAAFFRGQLLVMISLGIIYALGLWLIGLDVGLVIGALAGLISIVPYLGFFTGVILGIIATLIQFHSWIHVLLVIIVFGIGEAAESLILVPSLVGDRVGLHPVAVIFAILAGGQLFGFVGVLLAVPVSAVIVVLLRHLYRHVVHSFSEF